MDIDSLISEIFIRLALWDQKNQNHHDRFILDKLWEEVAVKLNTSKKNFSFELKKNTYIQYIQIYT